MKRFLGFALGVALGLTTVTYAQISGGGGGIGGGGGGGGTPADPTTSIQFNNSGAFGGSANLTWASNVLTVGSGDVGNVVASVVGGGSADTYYAYNVFANFADGSHTLQAGGNTVGDTSVGNATLDSSHYIHITWDAVPGAASYTIQANERDGTPSTSGIIGTTTGTFFNDTGIDPTGAFVDGANNTGSIAALRMTGPTTFDYTNLLGSVNGIDAFTFNTHVVNSNNGQTFDALHVVAVVDSPNGAVSSATFESTTSSTDPGGTNYGIQLFSTSNSALDRHYGVYSQISFFDAPTDIWGFQQFIQNANGPLATNLYGFWHNDLRAGHMATNAYYQWFDSRGVFRIREDNTFNSVGQAIPALYNPQFPKYTAGAQAFERIILSQWNSNVAEMGTEKGPTQTLTSITLVSSAIAVVTGHGYSEGDTVTVSGADQAAYNGAHVITIVYDADTFAYDVAGSPTSPATGTITVSPGAQSVSSLTLDGTATALATLANHGYRTGDSVTIAGASQTEFNGAKTVTRVDANTFTYSVVSTTSPATGTITAQSGTLRTVRLIGNAIQLAPLTSNGLVTTSGGNGALSITTLLTGTNGGTNNAFFEVTGPTTATKTFTFPNASATVLTTNAVVTVAQGGSGAATLTGVLIGNGTSAFTAVTAPSGTIVGTSDTQTLTNKRITPRVVTPADATSVTPNTDSADVTYQLNTQSAGTLTMNADGGTPTNGQRWIFKIKSSNAQTFSWSSSANGYLGGTVALPTASTGSSKVDYFAFIFDSISGKWHYVGTAAGF